MDFLCDITIMVRDVEFRAHRNILAAFSKYFSTQAEKGQEFMTLDPDKVSRYALEKLLEFVYTGQMNLSRYYKFYYTWCCFGGLKGTSDAYFQLKT